MQKNATIIIKDLEASFTRLNHLAFLAKTAYVAMDSNVMGGQGLLIHEYNQQMTKIRDLVTAIFEEERRNRRPVPFNRKQMSLDVQAPK